MRRKLAIPLLALTAVAAVAGASVPAAGADVSCAKFVSPSGSDGSGDGSFASPYATPQKLADSLAPGQTGCFRAGTYEFSLLYVRSPNITLAPSGTDAATLKGPIKVLPTGAGSTIEGLKLDGVNSNAGCTGTCGGGSPRIYADGVVLRDDEITDEHTGICVMVGSYYSDPPPRGVVIEQNRIHDCGRLPAANHDHGIYVSEARDAVIRDNWIYDNADRGIQLYPDAIGTTITGNVIYGNGEGQNFSCDASSCSKNNVVEGNIIADSVVKWNVYANSQGATPDGSNVLRDNCLNSSSSGNGGVDSNSAFYSESANLVAAPQFADPSRGDFVLNAASPCLAKYTGTMSLPQGSTGGGAGTGGTGGGSVPADTSLPTISGTAQVGQTLSASNGNWSGSPTSYAYQWRRCDGSGSNCASIAGATSNGYQPTSADIGSTVRVVVTATNSSGSASASSDATAAVAAAVPANTSLPTISGTAQVGQTLSASDGSWSGSPTGYAYQWRRCDGSGSSCASIAGATSKGYQPTSADVGSTVRVVVTASNASGSASASSEPTAAVAAASTGGGGGSAPANTSLPKISGTAQVGQKLSASNGSWSGSPTGYAYQWRRCDSSGSNCSPIAGATSKSYQPTSADIGSTVRVVVTATNASGSASASSDATTAVAAGTTTVVKITGGGGGSHPKARGAVLVGPGGSAARSTRVHGAVALILYRRSNGDWRAISRARDSRLKPDGHFRKRLHVLREHRLHPGTYRVKARYPGSWIAKPSVSRSPRFTIHH